MYSSKLISGELESDLGVETAASEGVGLGVKIGCLESSPFRGVISLSSCLIMSFRLRLTGSLFSLSNEGEVVLDGESVDIGEIVGGGESVDA